MAEYNNEKTHIISTGLTILHRMCQEIICFASDDKKARLEFFDDYLKTEKKLVANDKYFVVFWKELYHLIISGKVEKGAKIAVWFTHFNYEKDDPNYKNNLTIEEMLLVLEYCTIIFTKCDYWTNWLIRRGVDRNKIVNLIVGGGVDLDLFKKTNVPGEYIGVVGHYNPRKNGQFVLDLMRRMSDFPWMIVGDNWENIRNFNSVTKGLKNFRYVIYDKDVQYEDYPKFYQQMKIYLSVSEYEGGPIPALEALACGVPVVLSDTGFARNLVVSGHNGYVFPVNDLDLAEYFLRLAYARKFNDFRQTIINYTWENYARKIWQGLVRL